MIQEIFKGKGDPGIPAAYRDVLLADDDGKALLKMGAHVPFSICTTANTPGPESH